MNQPLRDERGMALVMVTVMMLVMSLTAVWLVNQGVTHFKITRAMTTYESTFNLADGAAQVSLAYLLDHNPPSPNWNPSIEGRASGLPDYMNNGVQFTDRPFSPQVQPDILWKGYDTKPLPGWMINWQGYSAFHRIHYKARGIGRFNIKRSQVRIGALVVKLAR